MIGPAVLDTTESFSDHQDEIGAKIGMWLFLFTEIILFAGLFLTYAVYRSGHKTGFHHGSVELSVALGTFNTIVLLTSSLFVALSITAIQKKDRTGALGFLLGTLFLGLVFLGIKAFEWFVKIHHGIYPGSEVIIGMSPGKSLFFNLYYLMTGLHAIHVAVGMALIAWTVKRIHARKITAEHFVLLENIGLYWHLVDVVWIFLFPMFYLVA